MKNLFSEHVEQSSTSRASRLIVAVLFGVLAVFLSPSVSAQTNAGTARTQAAGVRTENQSTSSATSNTTGTQGSAPISLGLPKISLGVEQAQNAKDFSTTLQVLAVLTILSLAPSILIMMTCFTRIIIVFHFLKQALGTQAQPPAQLLTALALFLTFFVMQPALNRANTEGLQPYMRQEIPQDTAIVRMVQPFREFMLKHTREEDLSLFVKLSGHDKPRDLNDISTWTVIPAYSISELRIAFQIGFILFIPFLVIDMIISSILMSLGMMMLPPQIISLPVKILLFLLVDGWNLLVDSLMRSIMT